MFDSLLLPYANFALLIRVKIFWPIMRLGVLLTLLVCQVLLLLFFDDLAMDGSARELLLRLFDRLLFLQLKVVLVDFVFEVLKVSLALLFPQLEVFLIAFQSHLHGVGSQTLVHLAKDFLYRLLCRPIVKLGERNELRTVILQGIRVAFSFQFVNDCFFVGYPLLTKLFSSLCHCVLAIVRKVLKRCPFQLLFCLMNILLLLFLNFD